MTEPTANPFEFFCAELASEDICRRSEAMKNVKYVAHRLGPEGTMEKLLPRLNEFIKDGDDECLYILAGEYLCLSKHIGREDMRGHLIPALTLLANRDEAVVRERAVQSLIALVESIQSLSVKADIVRNFLIPSMDVLSSAAWFPPRHSVCALFPLAYPYADDDQRTLLRTLFGKLANDDTPMVRRAAAVALNAFLPVIFKTSMSIPSDIFDTIRRVASDETYDVLRASANKAVCTLLECQGLSHEIAQGYIHPIISAGAKDASWRVRVEVAQALPTIISHLGVDGLQSFSLPLISKLLVDPEAAVRRATLNGCLSLQALKIIPIDSYSTWVLPIMAQHVADPFVIVRTTVASLLSRLARIATPPSSSGGSAAAQKYEPVQRIVLDMFTDFCNDEQGVRLALISDVLPICECLLRHPESINAVIEAILHLASADPQWRVRMALVEQLPALARLLGPHVYELKFSSVFRSAIGDPVREVRFAAIQQISKLAEVMDGPNWIVSEVLPLVKDLLGSSSYFERVTALRSLVSLAAELPAETVTDVVYGALADALTDRVANVRLVAAETLGHLIKSEDCVAITVESVLHSQLFRALESISTKELDVDVSYHIHKTLGLLGK